MRFPRIILNPAVAGWIRLLQRERRENARLRRELVAWQNTVLQKVNLPRLYEAPPKPERQFTPPVGPTAKKVLLAQRPPDNHVPTAEEILGNGHK